MKIAYISDSLGSRLHMRGIFNYSANLVKMLSDQGHELDLVVQRPQYIEKISAASQEKLRISSVMKTAIIYDALINEPVRGNYQTIKRILSSLSKINFFYRIMDLIPYYFDKPLIVKNEFENLDYLPYSHQFMGCFKNFLLFRNVYHIIYKYMPARKINLSAYDLILIDAPMNIKIKKNPNASIVNVIHDLFPYTDPCLSVWSRRVFHLKVKRTVSIANKYIFVSETTKQLFEKYLNADKPSSIIYPIFSPRISLDCLLKSTLSQPLKTQSAPIKIVTVVSFEERKNLQNLISAHHLLPSCYQLEIIGKIEVAGYKVSKKQSERVKFLGYVSETEKINLLYEADVLCFPSLAEGFGIPIIEGFYYTGRVVCSDIPVFKEIAKNYAKFCDPSSPWDIADKIVEICASPKLDAATRVRAVEQFSGDNQLKAIEDILN